MAQKKTRATFWIDNGIKADATGLYEQERESQLRPVPQTETLPHLSVQRQRNAVRLGERITIHARMT
jgi:hypothetical protein